MTKQLYKVSQATGKVQTWLAYVDGSEVHVNFGQLGGKITPSVYTAEPKSIGQSNETTAEEQAQVELIALYESQRVNKHYTDTQEEAFVKYHDCKEPRKITNYKDRFDKMPEVLLTSVKKNGSRACVIGGQLYSKIGRPEDIKVEHLRKAVETLGDVDFDCEVYAGEGISLQRVRSAWLKPVKTEKEIIKIAKERAKALGNKDKFLTEEGAVLFLGYHPNEDAPKLKFYVFDIPTKGKAEFQDRVVWMEQLEYIVNRDEVDSCFEFLYPKLTYSHKERMEYLDEVVANGSEGLCHYEVDGIYEFGKRSTNTTKSKLRYDTECFVEKITKDKRGEGVLHLRASDEMLRVKLKAKMKVHRRDGKEYARDYQSMVDECLNQWVTISYEELSDKGVMTKPVAECLRDCDPTGQPIN